ncbi:MAG TPA: exopolyphosphatase [Burkholderiales bacterium]|nr:exopolyphosphatase [Burkholderiales bacterium]
MAAYSTLAAVDLGSNSFHLQVARVVGDQIYPLDALREPVRLGGGLTRDKRLDESSQQRALDCLKRFGERLRGFDPHAVRAVGTNTLRVAKNAAAFLKQARGALGFPIEVVAGREEARLIYLGVSHGLPASQDKRLVIDIGGGSTELIIGRGHKPLRLASLYMGCVSYSLKYFPDGKITKGGMKQAELAARGELQPVALKFTRGNWQQALASSGTARALTEILRLNGYVENSITRDGLEKLRAAMLKAGTTDKLDFEGIRNDRAPVLPGGLAIMSAVLAELDIETLEVAAGAMRQGILYDLLGRVQQHDMRDVTVAQFMRRYHVDSRQARRVGALALEIYRGLANGAANDEAAPHYLAWAARLHEIGISVAYSGYHKHSAYIIQNADMPGFSTMEQARLASLVLAHRRSLKKVFTAGVENTDWRQVFALRLAVLIHRSRTDLDLPRIEARSGNRSLELAIDRSWLEKNPLTATALQEEIAEWSALGIKLDIPSLRDADDTAAQAA